MEALQNAEPLDKYLSRWYARAVPGLVMHLLQSYQQSNQPQRPVSWREAILAATRVFEQAYPVQFGGVLPDRLSEVLTAIVQVETSAVLQDVAEAA